MRIALILLVLALAACAADAQPRGDSAPVTTSAWRTLGDGSRLRSTDNPAMRITAALRCWPAAGAWDCLRISRMDLGSDDRATTIERLRPRELNEPALEGYSVATDPAGPAYRCEWFEADRTQLVTHRAGDAKQSAIAGLHRTAAGAPIRAALRRARAERSFFDCPAVIGRLRQGGVEALRRADLR